MTKISGAVEFSLDMRSLDGDFIESMTKRVCEEALKIEKKRGVQFNLGDFTSAAPGPMDEHIKTRMLSGADNLGIPYMEIASGASHDAAAFAAAGVPTQMLFIRNANGCSPWVTLLRHRFQPPIEHARSRWLSVMRLRPYRLQ